MGSLDGSRPSRSTDPLLSSLLDKPTMLTTTRPRPVPLPRKEAGGAMPSRQPPTLSRPTDPLLLRWLKQATSIAKKYGPTAIKMAKAGYKAYNSAQTSAQKNRKRQAMRRMFRKLSAARKARR